MTTPRRKSTRGHGRTRRFNCNVSEAELIMLRAIADAEGWDLSTTVRQLIRREHGRREKTR
jgi:hypothetical protein